MEACDVYTLQCSTMVTAVDLAIMGATPANGGVNPGVGGGLVAVSPGKLAIAAYSPPLDTAGNSVRGQAAIAQIAHTLGLGLFNT
jgi:glutaminase